MRYLTLPEVLWLHGRVLAVTGGAPGVRDLTVIESAIAQPKATFDGRDLYPDLISKAAALCFGLVRNHGFVDGNKRIGHAAMEVFLLLNGFEMHGGVADQERVFLALAEGSLDRDSLVSWIRAHVRPAEPGPG